MRTPTDRGPGWLRALWLALLILLQTATAAQARSHKPGADSDGDGDGKGKSKSHSKRGKSDGQDRGVDAALIDRVNAALTSRDFAGAMRPLGDAYRRNPDPEILYHMGRVLSTEGRVVEAQDLMRRYLADAGRAQDSGALFDDAQKVMRAPRPAAGEVALLADPGALVIVDERPLGVLPLTQPLLLSGGLHNLTLEYGSRKLASPVQAVNGRLIEMRFNAASGAVVFTLRPALIVVPTGPAKTLTDDVQRSIGEQAEQAAQAERLAVMPLDVAMGITPQHKDCLEKPTCQRDLARDNKAEFVLSYTVQSKDAPTGKSWQFDLTLRHNAIEEPASAASKACAPCTVDQAAAALKETLAQVLSEGVHRKRATIELSTEPPGAQVRTVAGQPLGKTPLQLQVWQGSHEVALSLDGYNIEKRRIEVTDSKRVPLSITLKPDVPEPPPTPVAQVPKPPPVVPPPAVPQSEREPRPRWRIATGLSVLGVGVALAGFGLSGVVLEDTCVNPPMVAGGTCRVVYNSAPTGGAIILGGVALVVTGTVLLAVPGRRRK